MFVLPILREEYRTQPIKRRGWVLVHASLSKASDEYCFLIDIVRNANNLIVGRLFIVIQGAEIMYSTK
ncbi:hypothetical protein NIES2101_09255 [Calothrix sp. HK-06]|nr:hypothetical protein NIES2101_09255 [Calothrix sp. HK-06]